MLMHAASQITIIKLIILSLAIFAVHRFTNERPASRSRDLSQPIRGQYLVQSSPVQSAEVLWMVFMGISIREGSWL